MKRLTASHKMLFVALIIYVLVTLLGAATIITCLAKEQFETTAQISIALFSYATICGSSTFVVYSNKAGKENVIEIAMKKYRMKIELAKEIYKDLSLKQIDEQSVALFKALVGDDEIEQIITPVQSNFSIPNNDNAVG